MADQLSKMAATIIGSKSELLLWFSVLLVLMPVSVLPSPSVRLDDMSLFVRKPVFGVSDQVRHKPGCTATEDG